MNAKLIIICILATLSLSSLAFAEKSGRAASKFFLSLKEKTTTISALSALKSLKQKAKTWTCKRLICLTN